MFIATFMPTQFSATKSYRGMDGGRASRGWWDGRLRPKIRGGLIQEQSRKSGAFSIDYVAAKG